MNIIVIVVDTLRYDHIAAHGNEWIKTPNLDRLAAESWVFDRAFTASFPTIPHRTDAMTGKYGSPFHRWQPLRHDVITFPQVLREAGYATQLIHDTPHLVNGGHNFDWPFHAWTQVRGAEVDRPWIDASTEFPENWATDPLFDFVEEKPQSLRLLPTYVRANRGREQDEDWNCARLFVTAARWLHENASQDRFLMWVDCFDPHEPWDVPPEFARLYDDDARWDGRIDPRSFLVRDASDAPEAAKKRIAAQYAAKVSWVDRWLGELLYALEVTGLARNTAVLLTSDHGTALAERGTFGKSAPVHEQEAHVPFILRVPDGGAGRSDMIVQPQDIFATVASLAGVDMPEDIISHDVLTAAREGGPGSREVALAGPAANAGWGETPERILFTVLDQEWYLELAAKPEHCRLTRLGSLDEVAAEHPEVVERLHAAGMAEIERRGIDSALMSWLRSQGEGEFPSEVSFWDGYPGPAGYRSYFQNLWTEW